MKRSVKTLLVISLIAGCGGPAATQGPVTTDSPSAVPPATAPATTVPTVTPSVAATPGSSVSGSAYEHLLARVPPVVASTCAEDAGAARNERALAVAVCQPEDAVDPEVTIHRLEYLIFDSDERRIDLWTEYWGHLGEPAEGECSTGPATSLYEVDGLPVGRLVCGPMPQSDRLTAWWYDDRVGVVMALFLDGGSYQDLANLVPVVSVQP